ncbi:two-component system sensor histidine kinase KdpD [Chitinivorax sp. PXF-14]|uniref:two-component system sensor histidine kinase KdpD n=1 Tax=Chitinivorax sp. PXF-14 TaxID=3230488 RepID=UPI00346599B0
MQDTRPDPDQLLEKVMLEEARQHRGRLKIFFGGCAGVGKTYAMLNAARQAHAKGLDVVVGIVETHGRAETARLLDGLARLPPRQVDHRGRQLPEFDLDAALARQPQLILIDELAHTNVEGSRHTKRWQDVEELLGAGIDVYTTVNVQHLERLNDIVGQITGIRVWETVPDRIFDEADEISLVDLPPDELLLRLKEGKVYVPHQAERAARHFFRKGNLIALRELALRRTADRVDAQMRDYRADQSISQVWQAKERLLLCVGPGPAGNTLVRSAARLAASLKADWIAVYVETPRLQRLSDAHRERILQTLKLAQELGAETATLAGPDVSSVLLGYAGSRNVSKLVVGKSQRRYWTAIGRPSLADELGRHSIDVDVYVVGHELPEQPADARASTDTISLEFEEVVEARKRGYLWALAVSVATTLIASPLASFLYLPNVVMLYLLGVVLVAVRYGHGPAVLSSFLSVAAFDFFFVPPRLSFAVSDTQYLLTFAVLLVVALVISQLTASLRYQAHIATYRERRTSALYSMAQALSAALATSQIIEIASRHLCATFHAKVAVLLPDSHEAVRQPLQEMSAEVLETTDLGVAQWVYDHQEVAGLGTYTLPAHAARYLPLKAPMRTRGVLAIQPDNPRHIMSPEQQRLLDTFAAQIALALERVHYVEVAQDAVVTMEAERLRNSLLSAISHDLRTPLTVIVGLASTLASDAGLNDETRRELATSMQEEAMRMSGLVTNLLDMARLQAGGVQLSKQWQLPEEVIGSALRASERLLREHRVTVEVAPEVPLVSFDAVLVERVLCNLLENAAKYTPPGSTIRIAVQPAEHDVHLVVEDNGPGLQAGMEEKVFDKFTRGEKESAKPGVGLGLAICRAIVEAHGGRIWADSRPGGGARFTVALPASEPPALETAEAS